ncbi:putative BPI/LBP family protein At1g04970 isoform X2 [Telopea speciosissima]|uniref:putative BPI/LBP family protein At1g04970 isoform X2 n=1 Tax=Telopea speciosissima TaxID=54955 RepID=UPI001CC8006C|nr:putative BPI/LBP family protein At1g04970 isoform X2 [Telopea speciosissima]
MATAFFFLLMPFFLVPASTHLQSTEEGFISTVISEKGLDFAKDILIEKAISSLTPLYLPQIEKTLKIPLVGNVHFGLSNITIYRVDVPYSYVNPGDTGIAIVASGATANLSMNWFYSYRAWFVTVSDKGHASIQVEGMEVGLTLGLANQQGTLKLSLMECGCYVKDIDITLNGGASWLYQGLVDAFEGQIKSSVENAITKKIKEGILKLDSLLKSLPNEVPVNEIVALNVTFVEEPVLSNSSIGFEIDGLFTAADKVVSSGNYFRNSQLSASCKGPVKMLEISLDKDVFNSASNIYYNAGLMQWIVDKVPDQSLLNTASWKYIVPQLYKMYPNDDMNLNVSLSSPPVIRSSPDNIDSTIYSDVTIDVFGDNEIIPVACISLVITASGSVGISGNNLVGSVELVDFTMSLKWSKIGNFHMYLIQSVMRTLLKTVFLPYVNLHLGRGFPLPIIRGFTLQNADIFCASSQILICSNVVFADSYKPKLLPYDPTHSLLDFGF